MKFNIADYLDPAWEPNGKKFEGVRCRLIASMTHCGFAYEVSDSDVRHYLALRARVLGEPPSGACGRSTRPAKPFLG